jgi:hypothetical protein
MNETESATFGDIKSVLGDSVEMGVRAARAGADASNERDAADFPLLSASYAEAIPPRCLPEVQAAAQRLRALTSEGERLRADAQVSHEALRLVEAGSGRTRGQDPAAMSSTLAPRCRGCMGPVYDDRTYCEDCRCEEPGCPLPNRGLDRTRCGRHSQRRPTSAVVQSKCERCGRPAIHREGRPAICSGCER